MSSAPATLATALDALVAAAERAGLDADTARREGEALAATVAERNKGAFAEWCAETGRAVSAEEFFEAAKRGNRFRVGPTPSMNALWASGSTLAAGYAEALGEVAVAAAALGEETPTALGNAATASSAQLQALPTSPALIPTFTPPAAPSVTEALGNDVARALTEQLSVVQRKLAGLRLPGTPEPTPPLDVVPPGDATPSTDGAAPVAAAPAEPPAAEPTEEAEPEEPPKTVEELLAELDELVGLVTVKGEIHRQAAVLRVEGLRKEAGLAAPTITRHMIFNGNPGTGKTTVARLVAGIYRALGLLTKGQLVEVDRSELVAGYLGQTAQKTAEVVTSAIGGVLFIDEAYSLAGDQYGREAVDTLVKEMEDHRDDLVVIVAGYPLPMKVFISENPGLESRFRTQIDFDDYSDEELVQIFGVMAEKAQYDVSDDVCARLRELLSVTPRGSSFGNARFVRNVLEAAIGHHAWRLREIDAPTVEQLRALEPDDVVVPDLPAPEEPVDPGVVDLPAGETLSDPSEETP